MSIYNRNELPYLIRDILQWDPLELAGNDSVLVPLGSSALLALDILIPILAPRLPWHFCFLESLRRSSYVMDSLTLVKDEPRQGHRSVEDSPLNMPSTVGLFPGLRGKRPS